MSSKILEISSFPSTKEYIFLTKERKGGRKKMKWKRVSWPTHPLNMLCVHVPWNSNTQFWSPPSPLPLIFMTFINCWPNVRIHFQRFLFLFWTFHGLIIITSWNPLFPSNISCLEYSFSWHQLDLKYSQQHVTKSNFFRDKPANIVYDTPLHIFFEELWSRTTWPRRKWDVTE